MRGLLFVLLAAGFTCAAQPAAVIQDQSHRSQVMGASRGYRVYLPPAYATAKTVRYPVVYWFHGYEPENETRDAAIAAYVAAHAMIVVDSGPADTSGRFPLYFPELIEQVDKTLRTAADRAHRGVTGSGAGGYLAIWQASKVPDLVGSASSSGGPSIAPTGPEDFEVDSALVDVFGTLDGVRVKQGAAATTVAENLDFHLDAFAHPLPKPANSATSTRIPISVYGTGKSCPTAGVRRSRCSRTCRAADSAAAFASGFRAARRSRRSSSRSRRRRLYTAGRRLPGDLHTAARRQSAAVAAKGGRAKAG